MIKSYTDYLEYLEADRVALHRRKTKSSILFDDIWNFQKIMRKCEYLENCKTGNFKKMLILYQYRRLSLKLGFTIPINVIGPGLSIAHYGTIVINGGARIGKNCRLHTCVNIGTAAGKTSDAPEIGDNCYIAPGVKMFGKIKLGNNMAIAANAVVNKSFAHGNCTIGGVPAKKISDKTSNGLLIEGYKKPYK
jgi:serine O-acetyltransferase